MPDTTVPTATMTSRQRWLAMLERRQPDRIPVDYAATGEFHRRIKQHLGVERDEDLWRRLHIDRPHRVGAPWKLREHPNVPGGDLWGLRVQAISHGTGEYHEVSHHPLAQAQSVADIEAFAWPSAEDFDVSGIPAVIDNNPDDRPVLGGIYEPFLIYCAMRGMEQAFEDLLVNPELADAGLARIFEFHYELNRRIWQAGGGRIDLMYLAEDLGGQTGPLLSLEVYRRFLLPNQIRMADLARQHGVHIIYHTDGAASIFLPDLVDVVGIEVLNPIQWRCPGMERENLVRCWGGKIAFHGGMDNQQTLPFGTVDQVIAEVKDNIRLFQGSRWVCAPCHNIQSLTPVQNVIAMYETIYEWGAY